MTNLGGGGGWIGGWGGGGADGVWGGMGMEEFFLFFYLRFF